MSSPVDISRRPALLGLARYLRALAGRMKRLAPRGLFGRSALLLAAPLIISQTVGMWVFYDRLWSTVMRRLSDATANDIALLVEQHRAFRGSDSEKFFLDLIDRRTGIRATFLPAGSTFKSGPDVPKSAVEQYLAAALSERNVGAFEIDASELPPRLLVYIQASDGLQQISVPRDRLYSSSAYIFLIWMVGTALITLAIAIIVLQGQVSALRRLAAAADAFGRGLDVPHFKPQGAIEVRQAANAFLTMRRRIQRQIKQRTEMLAAVSHDLRTPLTRMKLGLALLDECEDVRALESDVIEMQKMIEAYLSFARGEDNERPKLTDLGALLKEVVADAQREGAEVVLNDPPKIEALVRRVALKRCVTNLIANAARYGGRVWVTLLSGGASMDIVVDDNGPGIPESMREAVFQPFFRLESSRNSSTGGVGLGLTVARDVMVGHGGNLALEDSPYGGLRARASLPTSQQRAPLSTPPTGRGAALGEGVDVARETGEAAWRKEYPGALLSAGDFPEGTPLNAFFAWNEARWLHDRRFTVARDIYQLFTRFGADADARCICVAHLAIAPTMLWRWRGHMIISSARAFAARALVERLRELPAVIAAREVVERLLASVGSTDLAAHAAVFRAFDALEGAVDVNALARLRPRRRILTPSTSQRKILVIKLSALGDFIQALGPMAAIRRHHATDHITLLTTAPYLELAKETGFFDVVVVDSRPKVLNIGGWLELRRLLRAGRFDRVYDLQTSARSSLYAALFGPRKRPQWSGIAWLCSHPHANLDRYPQHTIDKQAEQLLMAGVHPVPLPVCPVRPRKLPAELEERQFVLLIPGSSPRHLDKRWPAAHYAALARRLYDAGYLPLIVGAPDERHIAAAIRAVCPGAIDLVGRTDLIELASLATSAALTIGNDTGATHMAAAGGSPVVVLFSQASEPSRCAPRGGLVRVLTRPRLADLSVDAVLAELTRVLGELPEDSHNGAPDDRLASMPPRPPSTT